MLAISSVVWLPLLTLVLGYVFSLLTEAFRDQRATRREREARDDDRLATTAARREELAERQAEYQKATLIELQEALNDLMSAYSEFHILRVKSHSTGRQWNQIEWPESLDPRMQNAERRTATLTSRVAGGEVRELISLLKGRGNQLVVTSSYDRADDAFIDCVELAKQAITRMGVIIRASTEDPSPAADALPESAEAE